MQHQQRRVQGVGELLGVAHHDLAGSRFDQRQHALARRPRPGDGVQAHVVEHVGIDMLGGPAQRDLSQGGEVAFAEEALQRPRRQVGAVDAAFAQAGAQLPRRQVDQLDLGGLLEHAVGQGLGHPDAGDARHRVVQAFQMLHVERGPDRDAGGEQLGHVLPALAMPAALDVGVGELVDQQQRRASGERGVEVELLERLGAVRPGIDHRASRQHGQIADLLLGLAPAMRLDDPGDDVEAGLLPPPCLRQHLEGLADAGCGAEEDLQRRPPLAARCRDQGIRIRSAGFGRHRASIGDFAAVDRPGRCPGPAQGSALRILLFCRGSQNWDAARAIERPSRMHPIRPGPPMPVCYPGRDLELSTYLSRLHDRTVHHLSASECETIGLVELLALADEADARRWATLRLGYADPIGAIWLREAAAAGYRSVTASGLVCFAGAQEALFAALHALLSPEDHAVIVLPSYQSMETLALSLCEVSGVALDAAAGWSLDLDAVADAIRPNTRVLIINFPNNPTGRQLEADRFDALVALCRSRGIWLLSDEVYRGTECSGTHRLPCAVDAYERGISIGATSKAYGLAGLRVGWIACREAVLLDRATRIRRYLSTCSAGPSEVLACIALKASDSIIARNRAAAAANLALLLDFFGRHPDRFACRAPDGGVVCYPSYKAAEGVEPFVDRMAATAGVLLLPARVFRSELLALPADHFRIGFGGAGFSAGLEAMERALG